MGSHKVQKGTGGTQGPSNGLLLITGKAYTSGLPIASPLYSTGPLCLESPTLLSHYYLWTLPLLPQGGPPPHTPSAT